MNTFDLMGLIAPLAGFLMFGWRGALLALLIRTEIKWRF